MQISLQSFSKLSDSNGIWTRNNLVSKWTLNHLVELTYLAK